MYFESFLIFLLVTNAKFILSSKENDSQIENFDMDNIDNQISQEKNLGVLNNGSTGNSSQDILDQNIGNSTQIMLDENMDPSDTSSKFLNETLNDTEMFLEQSQSLDTNITEHNNQSLTENEFPFENDIEPIISVKQNMKSATQSLLDSNLDTTNLKTSVYFSQIQSTIDDVQILLDQNVSYQWTESYSQIISNEVQIWPDQNMIFKKDYDQFVSRYPIESNTEMSLQNLEKQTNFWTVLWIDNGIDEYFWTDLFHHLFKQIPMVKHIILFNPIVDTGIEQILLRHLKTIDHITLTYNYQNVNTFELIYILIVQTFEQLVEIIYKMVENELFNARHKFLIVLMTESEPSVHGIFRYLWTEYFIFNLLVVDRDLRIYTWYPYEYSSKCGEIINVVELNKSTAEFYPNKVPTNKFPYSCPVRLMPFQAVPYLFDYTSKENPGLDIIMFNTIAEQLNLSNVFIDNPYPHYGFKLQNGTITYMFGALKRREVDFVFVQVLANESLSYDFDSLYPHMDDAFSWFAPTSMRSDRWDSLLTIFDNLTWSLIIVTIVFMSVIWHYYAHIIFIKRKKDVPLATVPLIHMSYQQCLMDCWRTVLTFSAQNEPKPRIIFLLWLFYCLIVDSAYQTNLVSVLTRPTYGKQVSNIRELIEESGLKYGFYGVIRSGFNDPKNKYAWHIYNTYTACGLTMECVNRTAFKRDFAAVKSTRQVKFLMPKWYTFDNGRPRLYIFQQKVFNFYYRAEVIKGLPFLDKFNRFVMEFWAYGLFPKWENDVLLKHIKQKDTDANKLTKISINNMLGVFILLALGLILAMIRFCYELWTFYHFHTVLYGRLKRSFV